MKAEHSPAYLIYAKPGVAIVIEIDDKAWAEAVNMLRLGAKAIQFTTSYYDAHHRDQIEELEKFIGSVKLSTEKFALAKTSKMAQGAVGVVCTLTLATKIVGH